MEDIIKRRILELENEQLMLAQTLEEAKEKGGQVELIEMTIRENDEKIALLKEQGIKPLAELKKYEGADVVSSEDIERLKNI